MRVKQELNLHAIRRIKGLTSKQLADRCPDGLQVFPLEPCTNFCCDWAIKQPEYMNCSWMASEAGDHSLETIGDMMDLTREGVRQIQLRALQKLRELGYEFDGKTTVHQQGLVPGGRDFEADSEVSELANDPDLLSGFGN